MSKRNIILSVVIAGLIIFGASAVSASIIWGTAVTENDWNSARTSDQNGGITANEKFDSGNFKILWNIEELQNGYWSYTYTLSSEVKKVSDFILEITEGSEDNFHFDITGDVILAEGPTKTWSTSADLSLSELYGIKFDLGDVKSVTFTIIADRSPVWGVFFAANEELATYAWSAALSDPSYKTNEEFTVMDFIARPDGGNLLTGSSSAVPEPPTMLLVGAGLIGLAGLGRNNIFKRKKR